MEKSDKYISPEVQVIKCKVELGFCNSDTSLYQLDDPTENPEMPW